MLKEEAELGQTPGEPLAPIFNFNGIVASVHNRLAADFVYNLFVSELKNYRLNFVINVRGVLVSLPADFFPPGRPRFQRLLGKQPNAGGARESQV